MKISAFLLLALTSVAFAKVEKAPTGTCYGLPMLAENTDVEGWDGSTKIDFQEVVYKGFTPIENERVYEATLNLEESEGDAVPTLFLKLERNLWGDRTSPDSYILTLIQRDAAGIQVAEATNVVLEEYGEKNGMYLSLNAAQCRVNVGKWTGHFRF